MSYTPEQLQAIKEVLESLLREPYGSILSCVNTETENDYIRGRAEELGIELTNRWGNDNGSEEESCGSKTEAKRPD